MAIQAEKRDAVAGFHSSFAESAGEAAGAFGELGIGEPPVAADDGGLAGKLLFGIAQESYGSKGNIHDSMHPTKSRHYQADWPPSTTSTCPVT